MTDPKAAVERLRTRIKNDDRDITSERDKTVLLEFSDRLKLLRETYGWHRHEKLLRHLVRISENADATLADTLDDREATEAVVRWIHDEYDLDETPETNQNYRVALRVFGRRATEENGDEPPQSIDWVNSTLPRDYDPSPNPGDMLQWDDDVEPMLEEARNPRDEAAIALQFDAGLRGGELYELTVGDLQDGEHGLQVSVDGKTGQRVVDLIPAAPHVQRWLAQHPSGDPSDPLWSHLQQPEQLSYQAYLNMFKRPAKHAGVEKEVTPTAFRKSNLAWLCRQGMNARHIERRQGRKHGSDAVARYTAIFDDDVGDEYARMMGLEVEEDEDGSSFAPVVCPRCDRETPRREDRCTWCGQALSAAAAEQASRQDQQIMEAIAENPDLSEDLIAVKEMLDEVPGARIAFERD
jgi:integrase